MKKLKLEDLKQFRDEMRVPISDAQLEADPYMPPYYVPEGNSPELDYMHERRRQLGGYLPERRSKYVDFKLPEESAYDVPRKGSGNQEVATTMAFVRMLKDLLKSEGAGERIQLIIPDEARTFGMDAFFPTSKIYNPNGMKYISVDRELLLNYKESEAGQILHTGINEAGSVAAFTASGSSYSTHGQPIIPIYIFYSMFGFQRTADSLWLAGDQMVRGFLIGATAGRTTLTGEGLQHADGHSPIIAYTNPAVISYDAAYGYEIAHIVKAGFERMYGGQHEDPNVMYYLTVYNEPMLQPAEPENLDVDGVLRGFKFALFTSSATLDASTTAYSTTNEVTGTGYTAGGNTLTVVAPTTSGTTAYLDFSDTTWSTATITARGALIYQSGGSNPAVAVLDFGADKTSTAGDFTIQFPTADASNAIIRIA